MIETIYKTQTPQRDRSECYVLVLTSRAASHGNSYAFMEEHGQWMDDLQRFSYTVNSVNAEEQLSYQHARGMYERAKRNLARIGFIHCFAADGQRLEAAIDQPTQTEAAIA